MSQTLSTATSVSATSTAPGASAAAVCGASRYLVAAAYRQAKFRRKVLDLVRHDWYRGRAPEFGIDEAAIVAHCRTAERRQRLRDLSILVVFVAFAHQAIGWIITDPGELGAILAYFAPSLALGAVAAGLILFGERLYTGQVTIGRLAGDAGFGEAAQSKTPGGERQNLIVYGGYSPFVGSGYGVGGWSFSVNLENTTRELGIARAAIPFETAALMRFVEDRLGRLRVDGLDCCEVLFADGRLVRDDDVLFGREGRPHRHLPPEAIAARADSPAGGTRSYLCVAIPDWRGEIVVSVYLRFKRGESNLYAEASYFILAPPRREFYAVDEVDPRWRLETVARVFFRSSLGALLVLAWSAFSVLGWSLRPVDHWLERRRIRRKIKHNPRFNFGATTSIRELGMENYYRVYFQQLDKDRHVKTIEQCTIDAIVEFLAAHNIDTSEIRDRRTAILNNGVIVAGGDINSQNLAVGSGARAVVTRLRQSAGRPPSANANANAAKTAA